VQTAHHVSISAHGNGADGNRLGKRPEQPFCRKSALNGGGRCGRSAARQIRCRRTGKAIDVKQIGHELGVHYLLEGSVRRAGDRIRIASELIDTAMAAHIWADHFDGKLSDIFDLQDQITASVVGAIEPKLRPAEIERARRKPTESVDAYDLFLRAAALNATRKREDNKEALRLLHRAVEIDPRYAAAYALASYCHVRQYSQGWVSPSDPAMAEGTRMARLAAEHGQDDPEALWMAGVAMSVIAGDPEHGLASVSPRIARTKPLAIKAFAELGFNA